MPAIGAFVELLVWCVGWAVGVNALALRRFNEPAMRGGLPGRIWITVFIPWLWLPLFVGAFWIDWLLWPMGLAGPIGMLIMVCEIVLMHWRQRPAS
ncbi:MAG TPA: hypothetical protein VFU74_13675 [Actinocrinis sp.]|nr:hypothetical protein [Actinocrinis sp.]